MNTVRIGAECAVYAAAIWASLFVIGWPIWTLVIGRHARLSVTTAAPLTGLAIQGCASWYWNGHFALDELSYGLVAVGAIATVGLSIHRRLWRRWIDMRSAVRTATPFSVLVAVTTALFVLNHHDVFRRGVLGTGILQQEDLPNYVLWSDHIRHATFMDPGNFAGLHLGQSVAKTVPGTMAFLAAGSAWTGLPTWQASMPIALVSIVLIASAARDLARVFLRGSPFLSSLVGIAAISGSLFVYVGGFYALSQLVAMSGALAATAVLVRIGLGTTRAGVIRGALEAGFAWLVVVLAYPHLAVLGAPIAFGVALFACYGSGWRHRVVHLLAAAGGVVVVCFVVVPSRVLHTIDYATTLSSIEGGPSPLQLLSPTGFLGLEPEFSARASMSAPRLAIELILLVAVVLGAVLLARGRDRSVRLAAGAAVAAALTSYFAVYISLGAGYSAWKWASFFVPLFVVGALAALIGLAASRWRGRARLASAVLVTLLIAAQAAAAYSATDDYDSLLAGVPTRQGWIVVEPELSTIGDGPAWLGIDEVDLDLPTLWETTWATYFVSPRYARPFGGGYSLIAEPSPARPSPRWRLVSRDEIGHQPPGSEFRVVNDRYLLVRDRPGGYRSGDIWIVGDCDGIYRFDGEQWRAVARSALSGRYDLSVVPEPRPAGTRAPLLVRIGIAYGGQDALLLEYLPGESGRLVMQHQLLGVGPLVRSETFPMPPGEALTIGAVVDPLTGTVRAEVDGVKVMDHHVDLYRPRQGRTMMGQNPYGLYADALEHFPGTITPLPQPRPDCTNVVPAGQPLS